MKFLGRDLTNKVAIPFSLCTQKQILELQEIFLTPGIHEIEVANNHQGRTLILTFLKALRCFNAIGCLTTMNALPLEIFDIHSYLDTFGYSLARPNKDLDRFFVEEFDCDFLWIETKHDNVWYMAFKEALCNLDLHHDIPIVIMTALK